MLSLTHNRALPTSTKQNPKLYKAYGEQASTFNGSLLPSPTCCVTLNPLMLLLRPPFRHREWLQLLHGPVGYQCVLRRWL